MQATKAKTNSTESVNDPSDQLIYRCGFEATMHPETFEQEYEDVIAYLQEHYVGIYDTESFRRGFDCGQDYAETLQTR